MPASSKIPETKVCSSEERSDPHTVDRRDSFLPGLPDGPELGAVEIPDELLDALLGGARTAEEIAGPGGLLGELTRRLQPFAWQVECERAAQCPIAGVEVVADQRGALIEHLMRRREARVHCGVLRRA